MTARPASLVGAIVLLAAWLGAALLAAAVVAPAAFAVLPTRTLAGALVGRVLPAIFWSGILLGLVLAIIAWNAPGRAWLAGTALALSVSCAIAQLVISPGIEAIRASIGGPVDALSLDDSRRQAFGRLHGMSVLWMGVGGIAALIALCLFARLLTSRSAP